MKRMSLKSVKRMQGLTLIELIVVIAVMGILGLIFTDVLVETLRGQAKVRIINQVKQNGQVVMEKLVNEIRQAESVVCVGHISSTDDTLVVFKGGVYRRFRFHSPTGSANGYIGEEDYNVGAVTYDQLCIGGSAGNEIKLTDSDTLNGVSIRYDRDSGGVDLPIFQLDTRPGFKDTVNIRFRAFQGVTAGQTFETTVKNEGILFTTTVQARGE
jgi:prepilin-type N-terminal cleavage/methylation domain-containing protein